MALYTAADLAALKAARLQIVARGAQEVEINGRRVKYLSLADLNSEIARAEADLAVTNYGSDIAFAAVED